MEKNDLIDFGLYITKADLARQLKVCPASINNMINSRRLPKPIRFGRRVYFYIPSVSKAMAADIKKSESAIGRSRASRWVRHRCWVGEMKGI